MSTHKTLNKYYHITLVRIITILLLFISSHLYGQNDKPFQYRVWVGEKQYKYLTTKFEEGEVNLSNGEFVYGLINRDLTEPIITVIDTDTTVYKTDEIVDFKLKHESKVISVKVNGEYVFLQYVRLCISLRQNNCAPFVPRHSIPRLCA